MSVATAVRIDFENLRSLAFGGISSGYAAVGLPFVHPPRMLKLYNTTNANLKISFDGVNDKDFVPANGGWIYDYGSNRSDTGGNLEQPAAKRLYVKLEAGAASSGNVYLTVIYAQAQ